MEGIRTLEYRPEDRESELRHDAELGRKARIAGEFLREYLDKRREQIVRKMEENPMCDYDLQDKAIELRLIKRFHYVCDSLIQRGEIAEEELRNGE